MSDYCHARGSYVAATQSDHNASVSVYQTRLMRPRQHGRASQTVADEGPVLGQRRHHCFSPTWTPPKHGDTASGAGHLMERSLEYFKCRDLAIYRVRHS